ncbi:putative quinol monooxygenase [Pseudomonas sp. LRF_L74]|uniref:putative quinol monooxygenase n=1 Tax=Pseudomonas sp. LRF_L74 TaxID=3369422 RepID=UPI003F646381
MHHAISIAHIHCGFGASEKLAPLLTELASRSRDECGCLSYALLRDGECWTLRGEWLDEPALLAHLRQPHLQVFGQLLASGLIRHLAVSTEVEPALKLAS